STCECSQHEHAPRRLTFQDVDRESFLLEKLLLHFSSLSWQAGLVHQCQNAGAEEFMLVWKPGSFGKLSGGRQSCQAVRESPDLKGDKAWICSVKSIGEGQHERVDNDVEGAFAHVVIVAHWSPRAARVGRWRGRQHRPVEPRLLLGKRKVGLP